jgi:putative membrane protein
MAFTKIFLTVLILSQILFLGCAGGPYNHPMGSWSHMMGYGYYGGFMWLIILVVAGIAIYFLLKTSRSRGSDDSIGETHLDILKKRYAKGEIDKKEFEQKRKDLES